MNVRFYVDPETEAPHIYNHGIDEEEVIDALASPGGGSSRPGRVTGSNRQDASRALSPGDLCSGPGTRKRVCDYSVRVARKAIVRLSKTLT